MEKRFTETGAGVIAPLLSRMILSLSSCLFLAWMLSSLHSVDSLLAPLWFISPSSSFIFIFLPLTTLNYSSPSDLLLDFFESLHNVLPLCVAFFWTCLFGLFICSFLLLLHLQHLQSLDTNHNLFWLFFVCTFLCLCVPASCTRVCCGTSDLPLLLTNMALIFLFPSLTLLPPRLKRRSDGGWPWQAAGFLWDPVRLVSHSAVTWPEEWGRL